MWPHQPTQQPLPGIFAQPKGPRLGESLIVGTARFQRVLA